MISWVLWVLILVLESLPTVLRAPCLGDFCGQHWCPSLFSPISLAHLTVWFGFGEWLGHTRDAQWLLLAVLRGSYAVPETKFGLAVYKTNTLTYLCTISGDNPLLSDFL